MSSCLIQWISNWKVVKLEIVKKDSRLGIFVSRKLLSMRVLGNLQKKIASRIRYYLILALTCTARRYSYLNRTFYFDKIIQPNMSYIEEACLFKYR